MMVFTAGNYASIRTLLARVYSDVCSFLMPTMTYNEWIRTRSYCDMVTLIGLYSDEVSMRLLGTWDDATATFDCVYRDIHTYDSFVTFDETRGFLEWDALTFFDFFATGSCTYRGYSLDAVALVRMREQLRRRCSMSYHGLSYTQHVTSASFTNVTMLVLSDVRHYDAMRIVHGLLFDYGDMYGHVGEELFDFLLQPLFPCYREPFVLMADGCVPLYLYEDTAPLFLYDGQPDSFLSQYVVERYDTYYEDITFSDYYDRLYAYMYFAYEGVLLRSYPFARVDVHAVRSILFLGGRHVTLDCAVPVTAVDGL